MYRKTINLLEFLFSACAAGLVRCILVSQLLSGSADISYDFVNTAIWSSVEPSVAIITACLPILRPVFRYLMPEALMWSSARDGHYGNSSSGYLSRRLDEGRAKQAGYVQPWDFPLSKLPSTNTAVVAGTHYSTEGSTGGSISAVRPKEIG